MTSSSELDGLLGGSWRRMTGVTLVTGVLYGLAMGSRAGPGLQALVSAPKVPLLLAVSTLLALPSVCVVNVVLGLQRDLSSVLRAILASQATVAVALAALAPLLLVVYASTQSYEGAKAANGLAFLVASLAGQVTLARRYAPLVRREARHRLGRRVWWFLYALVTIQVAWVMRPFVGRPGLPLELFRADAWGNAYVEVLRGLGRWSSGG